MNYPPRVDAAQIARLHQLAQQFETLARAFPPPGGMDAFRASAARFEREIQARIRAASPSNFATSTPPGYVAELARRGAELEAILNAPPLPDLSAVFEASL